MGLKPLEIYIKNSYGECVDPGALWHATMSSTACGRAPYFSLFLPPYLSRGPCPSLWLSVSCAGHKRAYCYGPEDLVDQIKKDMVETKFVKTKDITLTSAKGEVMQIGKPLSDYGVAKGDVLMSKP